MPRVLQGLFDVAQRLFGVAIREKVDVPKWHADVRYFEIFGASGQPTGSFYLDPYAREQKRSGAPKPRRQHVEGSTWSPAPGPSRRRRRSRC